MTKRAPPSLHVRVAMRSVDSARMAALGTALDARAESPAAVDHEPALTSAGRTWLRRQWPLLALGVAAAATALLSKHLVYPAFSWNRDEATYLWQMEALRGGHIFTTDGGAPFFYWPWLAGLRDGGFFSQYTVGWPLLLLAVDTIFGSPDLALVIGSVLAVLGTYAFTREITNDRHLAIVSAALMVASPILVIQSGVYLGYLFSLGLGLLFGTALLAGLRRGSRLLFLTAGVTLGWVLLTRPFDAVLWAAPMFAYAAIVWWRKWRPLWRAVLYTGVAFAPFVAFTLLYNRHVSGSFTTFPITAKDPLDTFGFGPRRLMPIAQIFDYSGSPAFHAVVHNFRTMPPFLVGGWLGVAVALVGIWLRRRDRSTLVLLGIAVVFPVGYVLFWGTLLSSRAASLSAPVYYIPLYAPACVFIATVLIAAWRHRRALGIALGVVLAAVTVPYAAAKLAPNHKISEAQLPWKDATRSAQLPALVIVENSGPYLMHLNPYSSNAPDLDGKILYALDRGPENLDAISSHPNRTAYLERTTDPLFDDPVAYHDAPIPKVSLVPLQVVDGTNVTVRVRVTNAAGPTVVAYVRVGNRVEQRTLSTSATPGQRFETEWTLAPAGSAAASAPGTVPLTAPLGTIRVGVASAANVPVALAQPQQLEEFAYRKNSGTGTVDVLTPSRKYVSKLPNHDLYLTEVQTLPGLDVELTLNR